MDFFLNHHLNTIFLDFLYNKINIFYYYKMEKIKKLKSVHECLLKQNETSNTNSYL